MRWLLVICDFTSMLRRRPHGELALCDRAGWTENHFLVMHPALLIALSPAHSLRQVRGDKRPMRAGDMFVSGAETEAASTARLTSAWRPAASAR